ncbi:hypothetical protein Mnod_5393 [Methylobacterium nodulans ORS 2060]|uniref:Uncharacterized protein n=1 Tax=Methylobacterium nodulans (strain LMG 21967 / CNCM I-2342 / ORS 2060) TaxID=460265 RepID=B8IMP5_METNO|nr:hypothetical protein Mnod_5393 [Methylobacterium nodulans ORS 2060]
MNAHPTDLFQAEDDVPAWEPILRVARGATTAPIVVICDAPAPEAEQDGLPMTLGLSQVRIERARAFGFKLPEIMRASVATQISTRRAMSGVLMWATHVGYED